MDAPVTLTRRSDFVATSKARRKSMPGFVLQARLRADDELEGQIRVGYTCSKKVGNAVARNRAKRRLRAAARDVLFRAGRAGWDYVLVGRREQTATLPYTNLTGDLHSALRAIHAGRSE
jgi:ribonuclease P protein component